MARRAPVPCPRVPPATLVRRAHRPSSGKAAANDRPPSCLTWTALEPVGAVCVWTRRSMKIGDLAKRAGLSTHTLRSAATRPTGHRLPGRHRTRLRPLPDRVPVRRHRLAIRSRPAHPRSRDHRRAYRPGQRHGPALDLYRGRPERRPEPRGGRRDHHTDGRLWRLPGGLERPFRHQVGLAPASTT